MADLVLRVTPEVLEKKAAEFTDIVNEIHLHSTFLQMQRAGKPLSIIYFKINANEVMSRQWPSFTIKSDLFRKDLWCSFPSNGGGKEVEWQAQ